MAKLTKQQVIELQSALNSVGNLSGVKFAYAVARNKAKIQGEIEAITAAQKASPEFAEFEEKRIELAKKYAKKNDKGEFELIDGPEGKSFSVEDKDGFNKEFESLKAEYKETLDAREKQKVDFENLLKEEIELDLYTIPFSSVPEDIKADQMSGLLPIIEEDK